MTRIIAFSSALLLLPLLYWDACEQTIGPVTLSWVLHSPREILLATFIFYPLFFAAGHALWLACRAFNFAMRKLQPNAAP